MPKLIFVGSSGEETAVEASVGISVMQTALESNIEGMDGDCGGECSCGTCHCFVERGRFPDPEQQESDMLEFLNEPTENSRLGCQLVVTNEMDGIRVAIPEMQG